METPKKKFDFVVHQWLAMAQMRTLYSGANFSLVAGGRK